MGTKELEGRQSEGIKLFWQRRSGGMDLAAVYM